MISLAHVEGWPKLPGEWAPWHDGLILPIAIMRFMDKRQPSWSTTVPADEIDRIQIAYRDAVTPILEEQIGQALTTARLGCLRGQMSSACRNLLADGIVPTDLSPVFNVNLDKIEVLWRDAERERETRAF